MRFDWYQASVEDKPLTIALHEIHEDKLRLRQAE